MRFEFATASRIIFGPGTVSEVPKRAAPMGRRALVITGRSPDRASGLIQGLLEEGISVKTFKVPAEPDTEKVIEGASLARNEDIDFIIGIGGGSVIDAGKAIAALLTNPGSLFDYLEVIGKAQTISSSPAPYIAIPTSAGTGTEVTKNAVIISHEHQVKVSMRSEKLLPKLVVVDPELTYSLPPDITAYTGRDALTQLMEAHVSKRANTLTGALCREGLTCSARSLKTAYSDGRDTRAREDLCIASLFSGIALAHAGLGAVHGFAAPIGGMFAAPHGLVCACLLPIVMDANIRALSERNPGSHSLERYDEIARILTHDTSARAVQAVSWVKDLCSMLSIPPLASIGISQTDVPLLVEKASRASSMKGNPVELTDKELAEILEKAISCHV